MTSKKKYVILSVSEISHDQSEKYIPISSSVGFFTIVQNDVSFCFLLRGKWHEVPIGDKKYVILSVSEISHDQSEKVHIPVSSSVGFFTSFRMT
ncbi:MAG: hypothetical protein PUH90_00495 [Clostridia bacterium]|nr:hypothetical protein [Clostridia bacterium]